MCERGELSRGVFEREPAVERIRRSAPGGVAQVVRDRVDADEQDARLVLRRAADERSIAGTKVDVDRLEGAGQLVESSTVYAALLPAFDDVHADPLARCAPADQEKPTRPGTSPDPR